MALIKLAREMSPEPSEREMDAAPRHRRTKRERAHRHGRECARRQSSFADGAAAGIVTDGVHTKAKISHISPRQINELLAEDYIVIVAGFPRAKP